jgi:hypothetical protein
MLERKMMKHGTEVRLSGARRVADLDHRCMRARVPGRWAIRVETCGDGGVRFRDCHDAKV